MRQLISCVLVLFVACKEERPPTPEERAFAMTRADARSSSVSQRARAAGPLSLHCCFGDFSQNFDKLRTAACHELRRILETETEPAVMEKLVFYDVSYPACYSQFPSTTIVRLCRDGCSGESRLHVVRMLSRLPPSPEIASAILHQLELPGGEQEDPDFETTAALALAGMGEPDLAPVLAALESPNDRVRRTATRAFSFALQSAPLEMPALLSALDRIANGDDLELAERARRAANESRRSADASPDKAVASLLSWPTSDNKVVLLGVRQFSCRAETAAVALEQLAKGPDRLLAAAAAYASTLREQRCPRQPGN